MLQAQSFICHHHHHHHLGGGLKQASCVAFSTCSQFCTIYLFHSRRPNLKQEKWFQSVKKETVLYESGGRYSCVPFSNSKLHGTKLGGGGCCTASSKGMQHTVPSLDIGCSCKCSYLYHGRFLNLICPPPPLRSPNHCHTWKFQIFSFKFSRKSFGCWDHPQVSLRISNSHAWGLWPVGGSGGQ